MNDQAKAPEGEASGAAVAPSWRVYLDQNILVDLANAPGGWQTSDVGKVLQAHAGAQVWVSPAHVVELMLWSDAGGRSKLANVMLDVSDARRMAPEYAYEVVEGFIAHVQTACPQVLSGRQFLDHGSETDKQLFLGTLALLACGRQPSGEVVAGVTRLKVENRWLRTKAATDPQAWVDRIRDCAKNLLLVPHDPLPELREKSLAELAAEVQSFEATSMRLKPAERRKIVNKQMKTIVQAYAVADTLQALNTVFGRLPGDIIFTLDIPRLHEEWSTVVERLGCSELPPDSDDGHVAFMLEQLSRCLWTSKKGIAAADIAQEVVLLHFLDRLNERGKDRKERQKRDAGKQLTDSVTFDADHASLALRKMHVFVTRDALLGEICRGIVDRNAARLGWTCNVVTDATELDATLSRLEAASAAPPR